MKKISLFITASLVFFWIFINEIYSQDLIIKLAGDTLSVTIVKITPDIIEYKYPNETIINLEYKKYIHKLVLSNGRVEIFNEKQKLPIIKDKKDWVKVIITFDECDIIGLSECGTIVGKSGWGALASVKGGEEAMKKMKKKAAEINAPIILITEGWHHEKNKPISGYGRGVKLKGKAYK